MRLPHWIAGSLAGLGLFAAVSPTVQASPTDAFVAQFTATKSGLPLGNARFQLAAGDQPNCYVYSGHADPNALVHMFLGNIEDASHFCIVDGQVQPRSFRHHVDGKPKKSYTLDFDWSAGKVRYHDEAGRSRTFAIQKGVQDPLSLQIAARRWLAQSGNPANAGNKNFPLADDDGIDTYTAVLSDGGDIQTPAGRYDTLKLVRGGDEADGLTFWLAKNADWMPIRVDKIDNGSAQYSLRLKSLSRSK
ncbi:DUF3108 domain-containing protein [Salinisphaera sp. SPP-AMP-43]|uniref:DUF3108 domain-containing protein n=1 Tax=Salinisphaera sp. SPP-AMP-43 TaxID=3121288 RepID=UPI003C6E396C